MLNESFENGERNGKIEMALKCLISISNKDEEKM